jgi:hypothetical protein
MTQLPDGLPQIREKQLNQFIASAVADAVNTDLLKSLEKLLDHAMNETWPPMYVLANARDAIDSAKRARGEK